MSTWTVLSFALFGLIALFATGAPVFICFFLLNTLGILYFFGQSGFGLFANSIFEIATSSSFAAVPLFILLGEIMLRSGAMDAMFDALDRLIGRVRGRQFVLCISLSAFLGALSGSAMGVAAMLGRSVLRGMTERGYDRQLSLGMILGGACLAPIIPPSVIAILIGSLADVSIAKLLIAGIGPGLAIAGLMLVYVQIRVFLNPALAPVSQDGERSVTMAERGWALLRTLPCCFIFFMVMGIVMLGLATPSEAAATGVAGAIVAAAIYRGLSLRMLAESLTSSMRLAAVLLVILASSAMFSQLLAFSGATRELTTLVASIQASPYLVLALMLGVGFILFMFVDPVPIMFIMIPVFQPIVKTLGFDPLWFWALFLINSVVGAISPPFGVVLFALNGAAKGSSLQEIYRAAWPIVVIYLLAILLFTLEPRIVTALPSVL